MGGDRLIDDRRDDTPLDEGVIIEEGAFPSGMAGFLRVLAQAIAGFSVIQADSVEQAMEITKSCPALDYGQTVEVRALA